MFICFAEYRIDPQFRDQYLALTARLQKESSNVSLYEGSDQFSLFVEVWNAKSAEEAEQLKEERCSERSPWHPITAWIAGGPSKLHVWTFYPVH